MLQAKWAAPSLSYAPPTTRSDPPRGPSSARPATVPLPFRRTYEPHHLPLYRLPRTHQGPGPAARPDAVLPRLRHPLRRPAPAPRRRRARTGPRELRHLPHFAETSLTWPLPHLGTLPAGRALNRARPAVFVRRVMAGSR